MPLLVKVAARESPLSQAQVKEVWEHLSRVNAVKFESLFLPSLGDLDLATPLTSLAKTDFFTQTVDALIIEGKADIAIHSAKDLPEPLDEALQIVAITEGVNQADSLVSFNYTLATLPYGAKIGVCSERRIQGLKSLREDLVPVPVRGTINHRIEQLKQGTYDALILAEAGLLRLKLDVPRQLLKIPVAPLQGKLAIVSKKGNHSMQELFKKLDTR